MRGVELVMIEIGDFIRTKQGEIAKIVDTNMFNKTIYKDAQDARYYLEDIVKHSKNIIDLIEVGDYVNGFYIDELPQNPEHKLIWHLSHYGDDDEVFKEEDIKTIVTKEQFESVTFKV